jgi:hypothetical protein
MPGSALNLGAFVTGIRHDRLPSTYRPSTAQPGHGAGRTGNDLAKPPPTSWKTRISSVFRVAGPVQVRTDSRRELARGLNGESGCGAASGKHDSSIACAPASSSQSSPAAPADFFQQPARPSIERAGLYRASRQSLLTSAAPGQIVKAAGVARSHTDRRETTRPDEAMASAATRDSVFGLMPQDHTSNGRAGALCTSPRPLDISARIQEWNNPINLIKKQRHHGELRPDAVSPKRWSE